MGLLRDGRREPLSRTFARHRKPDCPLPLPAVPPRNRSAYGAAAPASGMRARRVKTGRRPGFSEARSPVPKGDAQKRIACSLRILGERVRHAIKDKPGCFAGKIMNQ